jgi:hypothetical protein
MRVSYEKDAHLFNGVDVGRNPTFTGCGFHINLEQEEQEQILS